ncbi:MAG TPA: thioesterase family protein [Burkholderiales bacterium]|nr:thioesterase family protein [Burkholderiales bacterium]
MDIPQLKPGLRGSIEIVVGEQHTAPHIGSGRVRVLATPVMVNLMEAAALQAVEGLLPPGHQTVGIHLDVTHVAATPVGMRVRASAELTKVEKRTLTFSVHADDEKERIGEGMHERIIINLERFDARMQEKIELVGRTSSKL